MDFNTAVEVLTKVMNKWHPCDKKTEALNFLTTELEKYQEKEKENES